MSSLLRKRFSALLIPTLVLIVLVYEFWTTSIYTDHELASMRESAVALARAGDIESALEKLRALSEVAPNDRLIWGDYLTELLRAGRDEEALTLFSRNRAKPLPDYALAELFDAALRRRDVDLARELADREIAQSADRNGVIAARERALMDSGLLAAQSSAVAPIPTASETPRSEEIVTDSHAIEEQRPSAIIAASNNSVQPSRRSVTPPNSSQRNNSASRQQARAKETSDKSLPAALGIPEIQPENTAPSLADRARDAVREAEQAPAADRITRAQEALPIVDEYIASLPPTADELRNAKLDRVRALTLANRYDEAAELFESLGDPENLPLYGIMHGADLYARRHEPERAEVLLNIAAKLQPNSRELLSAQFYNQLDLEKYEDAEQTLKQLRENSSDESTQRDTEILSAMFAAYQNHLQEAQARLEKLQSLDPDNADIQLRLAQIYRWRGWPRRSLSAYRAAQERGADSISAKVGEIAALNDVHAFKEADEQLQGLVGAAPNHPEVMRAQDEQAMRDRWDYSAEVLAGKSTDSPVTGGGDIAFEQKLYSPLQAKQFRAFVHQRYDWADFSEGSGKANRLGIGGDYRSPSVDAAVEIGHRSPSGDVGLTVDGEWKFDDHLSVFGEVQTDSDQVPLRALNAGIDGYSATMGARYRFENGHAVRASYSRAEFSDDNRRDAISAQYEQRLFTGAHHQLSGIVQGYYSDNSAGDDVPYFNPGNEKSFGVVLKYDGILWRRYERNLSHYVRLGAANYMQQGFDSGAIWDVEYGQRWQLDQTLSFNYGLQYRSRIYDGSREGYSAVLGGVNWRF